MSASAVIGYAVCFLSALSSGMGAGGGGLLTMWLSSFSGVSQLQSQGINLISFLSSSFPASFINVKRFKPDMRLISFLTFAGASGCVTGALAASFADPLILRKCFGAFLLLVGMYSLYKTLKTYSV